MSSLPPAAASDRASGSSMLAAPPPAATSNDRNSGSMSSQLASRPAVDDFAAVADEKSGARNGFDIWYCFTDCGTTRLSSSLATGASVVTMRSSGESSAPASSSIARLASCCCVVSGAVSVSSWMSDVSRAAVFAMIVAMPSRRVSSLVRSASVSALSVLMRARASRTRAATTRNFTRFEGATLPRSAEFSIARTVRARIGMMPVSSWC